MNVKLSTLAFSLLVLSGCQQAIGVGGIHSQPDVVNSAVGNTDGITNPATIEDDSTANPVNSDEISNSEPTEQKAEQPDDAKKPANPKVVESDTIVASTEKIRPIPVKPKTKALIPLIEQRKAAVLSAAFLERYAYDKKPIDEKTLSDMFDKFLKNLDGQHIFFDQQDINEIESKRKLMLNAVSRGDIGFSFDIFNLYRKRIEERYDYAIELLNHPLDLYGNDVYKWDRKDEPWPKDLEEVKDIWRKRVVNDYLRLKIAGQPDARIVNTLQRRYANARNRLMQYNNEEVGEIFINAFLQAVDPHAEYYSATSTKNFNVQISLSVEGIGAVLQKRDENVIVREVVVGGPAAKAGVLKPGDHIVGVGQGKNGTMEDVYDWRLQDVVKIIRGKSGSTVCLNYVAAETGLDGEVRNTCIVRDKVLLEEQAVRSKTIELDVDNEKVKVGILTIPSFYDDFSARGKGEKKIRNVTSDTKAMLLKLKEEGVKTVLIDLRDNGGGSLTAAASMSGLFIGNKQPIVQVRGANQDVDTIYSDTNQVWDGAMGVLINRFSASASEIFAGVINDFQRGVVIGTTTWGKGSVQSVRTLNDLLEKHSQNEDVGSIKWTVRQFFRVNGSSTQLKGVDPMIYFPHSYDFKELGESRYTNALPWTEIAPSEYEVIGSSQVAQFLPTLKESFEKRTSNSPSWKLLLDEVDYGLETNNKKEASLNYYVREEERKKREDTRLSFKKRHEDLGESDLNVFSLDDGLVSGEGNLKEELSREKKLKEHVDTRAREAARIVAQLYLLQQKTS